MKFTRWEIVWYGGVLLYGLWRWIGEGRPGFFWGALIGALGWILLDHRKELRDFKRRQARRGRRAKLSTQRKRSKWEIFHSPKSQS